MGDIYPWFNFEDNRMHSINKLIGWAVFGISWRYSLCRRHVWHWQWRKVIRELGYAPQHFVLRNKVGEGLNICKYPFLIRGKESEQEPTRMAKQRLDEWMRQLVKAIDETERIQPQKIAFQVWFNLKRHKQPTILQFLLLWFSDQHQNHIIIMNSSHIFAQV
jgi:hypothetical protein